MLYVIAILLAVAIVEVWYLVGWLDKAICELAKYQHAELEFLRERLPETAVHPASQLMQSGEGRALLRARLQDRLSKRQG